MNPVDPSKQALFDGLFMIAHPLNVNIIPLDSPAPESKTDFEAMIPHAFRMSGQFGSIDSSALRQLAGTGEQSELLVNFLNAQAKKIDWMLSYILEQQDDPHYRHNTIKFGGAGLVVNYPDALAIGVTCQVKLFIPSENSAVYCLGEVIACDMVDDEYHIAFVFTHIREMDQELLVRATLHLQTRQLRERNQNTQE